MKWLFLVNDNSYLMGFLGKLAGQVIKEGDDCLVVINSKIVEYQKKNLFPEGAKFVSKVDWLADNYQEDRKEYGDLSWREIFLYKILDVNYDYYLKLASQLYQFFDFIFSKERPDLVISEPPAGLFHQVVYYFCRKNNIPYLGLGSSKFSDRIDIYDEDFTSSKYEKTFTILKQNGFEAGEEKFAKDFTENFVTHKSLPSYMGLAKINTSQTDIIRHLFKRTGEAGPSLLKYLKGRKQFKDFDYESEAILKSAPRAAWKTEKRKFRIFFQKNIFKKLNNDKDFFLFPLHFQPEASTSVYATYYCDQLNTIKNISLTLPLPCKLYLKEHPVAVGTRPKSFYEKLKEIPNVVLISPDESAEKLIRNSLGVITLTSTMGMEAALLGKPVYVLGSVFYSYHPLCRIVRSFEDLKEKIKRDLADKPNIGDLEDINNRFIVSYYRNTTKGDILSVGEKNDENDYSVIFKDLKKAAQRSS